MRTKTCLGHLLLLVLVFCGGAATAVEAPLPLVFVTGRSPYEVGRSIGAALKADFAAALAADAAFSRDVVPWARAHADAVGAMLEHGRAALPDVDEELRGLSAGLGCSPPPNASDASLVEILSVRPEIEAFLQAERGTVAAAAERGCTDVLLRHDGQVVHGHNEDWAPELRGLARMLCVRETFAGAEERSVWGLVYPGYLLGNTFAWSSAGFTLSTNALPPRPAGTDGVARYWANRHVLSAASFDEARQRVLDVALVNGLVHGFATSLGSMKTGKLVNYELAHNRVDEKVLGDGEDEEDDDDDDWLWHVNMYTRLQNVSAFPSTSSEHRSKRLAEIATPQNASDVARILGDTKDGEWPIYRNASGPDSGTTLATAIFDIMAGTVSIYSLENPAHSHPVAVLRLPTSPDATRLSWQYIAIFIGLAVIAVVLFFSLFAVSVGVCKTTKPAAGERYTLIQ